MTAQQRKALHKWFELLAEALNDAGFDMKTYFEQSEFEQPAPWTKTSIKETLWRRIQVAMFDIDSTEDIDGKQFKKIQEVIDRNIGEATGVYVPFPTEEEDG